MREERHDDTTRIRPGVGATSDHASMFEALAGGQAMSVSFKLTWDAEVDVAYLTLRPTGPADVLGPTLLLEHDRAFAGAIAMDFGLLDGRAVGFEFQMASACLPAELLAQTERSDGRSVSDRLGARILRGFRGDVAMGGPGRCTSKKRRQH